jgi:hypothetical protein
MLMLNCNQYWSNLSWIELTGSNINYTPPANRSVVEYELTFYAYSSGTQNSGIGTSILYR